MPLSFLEFEQPIAELEAKIDELKFVSSDAEVNIGEEIARLRAKSRALTTSIFASLSPWQVAQLARHPQRPYTLDYAAAIFDEFQEMHGDRMYADDLAAATPRSACAATTACRSPRATARRFG
jgi:acetyl-CoA carboxylase carboxyl transferase subunit alpha